MIGSFVHLYWAVVLCRIAGHKGTSLVEVALLLVLSWLPKDCLGI